VDYIAGLVIGIKCAKALNRVFSSKSSIEYEGINDPINVGINHQNLWTMPLLGFGIRAAP